MIGYVSFAFWLTTSCVITSRLLYGPANGIVSFFVPWLVFHLYMYQFFVRSSLDGRCGRFHVSPIVILLQCRFACLCLSSSVFLGYSPRSGRAGSYSSSRFTFWRHLHSVPISGSYQVTSHFKLRVCVSPQPLQHWSFVVFLLMVFLSRYTSLWLDLHVSHTPLKLSFQACPFIFQTVITADVFRLFSWSMCHNLEIFGLYLRQDTLRAGYICSPAVLVHNMKRPRAKISQLLLQVSARGGQHFYVFPSGT